MYICNNCESVFDGYEIVEEHHPYGEGTAAESWAVCPYCKDNDFTEAEQCKLCGEFVVELLDGLCEVCYGDMYGE